MHHTTLIYYSPICVLGASPSKTIERVLIFKNTGACITWRGKMSINASCTCTICPSRQLLPKWPHYHHWLIYIGDSDTATRYNLQVFTTPNCTGEPIHRGLGGAANECTYHWYVSHNMILWRCRRHVSFQSYRTDDWSTNNDNNRSDEYRYVPTLGNCSNV